MRFRAASRLSPPEFFRPHPAKLKTIAPASGQSVPSSRLQPSSPPESSCHAACPESGTPSSSRNFRSLCPVRESTSDTSSNTLQNILEPPAVPENRSTSVAARHSSHKPPRIHQSPDYPNPATS